MGTVRHRSYTMKQFAAVCALLMLGAIGGALGRPRYIVIEVDDEQFAPQPQYYVPQPQTYSPYLHRVTRSAYPQEEVAASVPLIRAQPPNPENRRNAPPPPPPPYGGPAPVFEIPAELRQNGDAIAAGSNNYARSTPHGPDYVDYGAYTGGYGAFGWYSDHPVGGHHH